MKKLALLMAISCVGSSGFAAVNNYLPEDLGVASNLSNNPAYQTQNNEANSVAAATMLPSNSIINMGNTSPSINNTDSHMFGAQLFKGAFASSSGSTFNSSYMINPGDNIQLRLWGAYQFAGTLTVDPQGNIFIPNVGPLKVAGVNNGQLQNIVQQAVRRVYVSNVGVYAALEQAQPVKVLVTGSVTQPGSYGGVSSDSVLAYLDRAGGVDSERGSYVDVEILRNGRIMQYVNLYDFLLAGQIQPFAFKDGDVIVVAPRKHTFSIGGEVYNAYDFEFDVPELTVAKALSVARLKPGATNISIMRRQGTEFKSEYYTLAQAQNVLLQDGDVVTVTADRYAGTIQVRIEGAHNGAHAIVLPYGSTLKQVLQQIKPNSLSQVDAIQLFRPSVAVRQKEMLNISLDKLEEATLSVRSATREEAELRLKDAELIKQFVAKARQIQPKGQVILNKNNLDSIILEQGDTVSIPEKTSITLIHGEVMFPNAVAWAPQIKAKDYIKQVGGYTQKSNKSKIIIIHQNGESELVSANYMVKQGDEIMVLPKVSTKSVEIGRGLTQILYQLAIAAKVVLDF
ncbi:polysialic acid transporter [Alkanindiges hydrocarboniclasticus]|uniref:Polysialic acid transporter n=1 Tax=Alkanindiges hydrocarboniclasticus TaxID=1907941 RepID=A0A1S8CWH3_9GAMM|nr:polysaccharide biosynthesis/export family protein [Alkanindiges hydrocarboniclasticus]ONG41687.1 polysialic acid transporter [Alkanindiges hydrocarboniclasticus]